MRKNEHFMNKALLLAAKGKNSVLPNPRVGAVIEKNGKIVGSGYHEFFGGKHAEINAIENAGKKVRGASLYVTLEPCAHFGKQPPCAPEIVKAGIKEVFIASLDPSQKKKGIAFLKKNKVKVHTGILEKQAIELNKDFFKHSTTGLPFVTLKVACTMDGKITFGDGKNKRISGKESRKKVIGLRKNFQAIIVGKNTVLKDNPHLTARDKKHNPLRVVLASDAKLPLHFNVFSKDAPTLIACTKKAKKKQIEKIISVGAGILLCKEKKGKVGLKGLMKQLGSAGIASVLVETGQKVFEEFCRENIFDEIVFIVSPRVIGKGKGIGFREKLFSRLVLKKTEKTGNDLWLFFGKKTRSVN